MLVDAHAHLSYVKDLEETLREAYEAGVREIMAVSMDIESYEKTCAIKSDLLNIHPALGIHPWNAVGRLNELQEALEKLRETQLVGEIGLDHFTFKDPKEHDAQLKVFTAFLEACRHADKVVNIHSTGAEEQVLAMLQEYGLKRVNMHWFDAAEQKKPLKLVPKMLDLGYYLSVTPAVTTSSNMQELVRMVPLKNLLTETDTHPLVKYGEAQSAPKMVRTAVEGIAAVKNVDRDEVELAVAQNFERLMA
jgi:TatD DNase family protein